MEKEAHLDLMDDEPPFPRRGCCCCFNWGGSSLPRSYSTSSPVEWWERMRNSVRGGGGGEGRWWSPAVAPLAKVREWSELVAGPRWKTFIRRFSRHPYTQVHGGGSGRSGWRRTGSFQYDPLSYSLNFDEGHGGSPDDETFARYRSFSMRSTVTKPSVDVGGLDAPAPKNSAAPTGAGPAAGDR